MNKKFIANHFPALIKHLAERKVLTTAEVNQILKKYQEESIRDLCFLDETKREKIERELRENYLRFLAEKNLLRDN